MSYNPDDPSRRSVRLTATIRPPAELAGGDLADRVIAALRSGDVGVDVHDLDELGEHDPLGDPALDERRRRVRVELVFRPPTDLVGWELGRRVLEAVARRVGVPIDVYRVAELDGHDLAGLVE